MSIVDEITRLTSAKADIKAAIEAKGVSVPSSAKLDAFPSYVSAISVGGENYEDEMITRDFQNWISGGQLRYSNSRISCIGQYGLAGFNTNYYPWGTVYGISMTFPNVKTISAYGFADWRVNASIYLPEVESIGSHAFSSNTSLITVSAPKALTIGSYAFRQCYRLTSASFPEAISIGDYAFYSCYSMTSLYAPKVQTIGAYLVQSTKISSVDFPYVSSVPDYAFSGHTSLRTAYFSRATHFGNSPFRDCKKLSDISFPELTYVSYMGFYGCASLTTLDFPKVSWISADAFNQCARVSKVSFPLLERMSGGNAFAYMYSLASAYFPLLQNVSNMGFAGISALSWIRFDALSLISNSGFYRCVNLLSLYLLSNSVTTLSQVAAFLSTPISTYTTSTGGVHGSIFVRASLLETYKTATNWATYSSRFVGLTDEEIAALPF